jgi:PadR family transcriptional regulator, regulatory protein PadR
MTEYVQHIFRQPQIQLNFGPFFPGIIIPTIRVYFDVMKKYHLGEFEELVMLAIGISGNKAYSVSIKDELESRLSRTVSMGALHTALKRMEDKGFLRSFPGESTEERAGRPKRYFEITAMGKKAVQYTKDTRDALWKAIPKTVWEVKGGY